MIINLIDSYGQQAGKIWQVLSSSGSLNEEKLLEITEFSTEDFHSAVGWLARENKISKTGTEYKLGETNLTVKIGHDAGKIWRVLDLWGNLDLISLSRLTRIEENDVFFAIGWLAKEGKIDATKSGSEKKSMRFWLK